LGLNSGILIGVPVPEINAMDGNDNIFLFFAVD